MIIRNGYNYLCASRIRPTKAASAIYEALHLKPAPFRKIKICRRQPPP